MTIPVPTCIRGTKNCLVKYTSGLPMGIIKEREEGTTCMQYTAPPRNVERLPNRDMLVDCVNPK